MKRCFRMAAIGMPSINPIAPISLVAIMSTIRLVNAQAITNKVGDEDDRFKRADE